MAENSNLKVILKRHFVVSGDQVAGCIVAKLTIAQFAFCEYEPARQSNDSAAHARARPVVRWTANRDEMDFRYDFLRNVKTTTLHRGTPEMGTFNHHAHVTHFQGVFYAVWDTPARDEHGPGQHGLLRRSADNGRPGLPSSSSSLPWTSTYVHQQQSLRGATRGAFKPRKSTSF